MTHPVPICANVSARADEPAFSVECLTSVLEHICKTALEELNRSPHMALEFGGEWSGKGLNFKYRLPFGFRGAELDGVLFGKREATQVHVLAFRQALSGHVSTSHARLAEEERQTLVALIAAARADHELRGLEPVGWFRAHLRSQWDLSEKDHEVFDYFFNEPGHVGLVLRPSQAAGTEARLYLRGVDGAIHSEDSVPQLSVTSVVRCSTPRLQWQTRPSTTRNAVVTAPPSERPRSRIWPALLILSLALPLGYWWINLSEPVLLRSALKDSRAANPDALHRKQIEREAAALWNRWENEAMRGGPEEKVQPEGWDEDGTDKAPQPETPAPLPEAMTRKSATTQQPAPHLREARGSARTDLQNVKRLPSPPWSVGAVPAAQAVMSVPPKTVAPPPAPVTELARAAAPVAQLERNPLPPEPFAVTLPAARNNAINPPPGSFSPSTGRLIWTGRLRKNEAVIIDGTHTSTGSVTGVLPGKPVRITVWPGDLTDDGIVWYTSDAQRASRVLESPGPQNGWNKTLYRLSPPRASEIVVVEAPAQQNAWQRLVLRSKSNKPSLILVQWTRTP